MARQIEELILRSFHAELTDQERQALSDWVVASPQNAKEYFRYAVDERSIRRSLYHESVQGVAKSSSGINLDGSGPDIAGLMDLVRAEASTETHLVELAERTTNAASGTHAVDHRRPTDRGRRTSERDTAPVLQIANIRVYRGHGQGNVSLRRLGLAAVVALAGVLVILNWRDRPVDEPGQHAVVDAAPPTDVDQGGPVVVIAAMLVDQSHVVWASGSAIGLGEQIAVGTTLRLESGFISLRSERGVMMTVEGPSELEVTGDNRLRLARGRLVADVPDGAKMFTIDTPTARVVDYGTEFGVEVDATGKTDAAVFKGVIELSEVDDSELSNDDAPRPRNAVHLRAGWSSSVAASGELAESAEVFDLASQARFVRTIEQAEDAAFFYRRAVMSSSPLAYWAFEELGTGGATNRAMPGRYDLLAWGQVDAGEGVFGQAPRFTARPDAKDYLRSMDPIDALADADRYSISLWCKLDKRQDGRMVGLFVSGPTPGHYSHAVVVESNSESIQTYPQPAPAESIRFLHRDPPGEDARRGANIYAPGLIPGRWVHLVVVKDVDSMSIYMNGELVDTLATTGVIVGSPEVMIGLSAIAFEDREVGVAYTKPFKGLIDEVAIYDRLLRADEIAGQHRIGRQHLERGAGE